MCVRRGGEGESVTLLNAYMFYTYFGASIAEKSQETNCSINSPVVCMHAWRRLLEWGHLELVDTPTITHVLHSKYLSHTVCMWQTGRLVEARASIVAKMA